MQNTDGTALVDHMTLIFREAGTMRTIPHMPTIIGNPSKAVTRLQMAGIPATVAGRGRGDWEYIIDVTLPAGSIAR